MDYLKSKENILLHFLMVAIAIGFGFYSVHLGIDSENDSYNYHFYNGFAYLNNRTFTDLAPAGLHSYFNPFLDALVYLGITNLPLKWYAFIVGFIQGLNVFPIYFIAKNIFKSFIINKLLIVVISLIGLLQSLFLTQLGVSMHDSLTSLFVLICLSFFISYYPNNKILGFYFPSFLIGCVVGLKLTTATYGVSFGLIIFIYSIYHRNYKLVLYCALLMFGGFFVTNGWWMYKLWINFDNPFYPYFNHIFKSPLAVTDASAYIDEYFFRQKGLQKIFYPIFFSNEPGLASGYFGWPLHSFYKEVLAYLLSIIIIFALSSKKWRKRRSSYLTFVICSFFIFCVASYIIWYLKFGVLRYLMPVLLVCPIIIILSIMMLLIENNKIYSLPFVKEKWSRNTQKKVGFNVIFLFLTFVCVFLTYKDLKNGFPMDAHKPITDKPFILENKLNDRDNNASVYFITGTPRVWQAWVFPALNLKGLAVPLKSGIFKYENDNLIKKRVSKVDEILMQQNSYAIVIRDLTGNGWISKATSDEDTNNELKVYKLKLSSNCREYDSGFGSNIHRLKFCDLEPL
ncbi:hypothetical protein [Glaesserella sp.]|uniref:hypothetical protein n=1 Tax=Glaesserella sp. TaxID=2094731 RepID=UPI0035A0E67E